MTHRKPVAASVAASKPAVSPAIKIALASLILLFGAFFAQMAGARAVPTSFADLAERLSPAVVNISTSQTVRRPDIGPKIPELPQGSPFEDLFKDFFDRRNGDDTPSQRRVQSLGSGFVIDPKGYIVTNNHVIENADEIVVNFANGDSLDAELVGTDPKTDLALLKLVEEPDSPIPFVNFGDSDGARVGDWVIAIGNPFGLGGSVSAGIISARNRNINSGPYDDFLQTDAAINRGNSGGPLFDMAGDVIGVNTAIYSPTGGSVGVGFSVPSNIATNVVEQLREFGETRRGWIGVRIREVSEELAEGLSLDKPRGALVEDVTGDGPADEGGVEIGDVILSFDGKEIEEMRDLPRAVAETPAGDTVRVIVSRKGKTQTLKIAVGLLDADGNAVSGDEKQKDNQKGEGDSVTPGEEVLGMSLLTLNRKQREVFELEADQEGVVISDVESTSAAARKGLRRGDVIIEVAQEAVNTPEEVAAKITAQQEADKSTVLLLISRRGEVRFVALRFEDDADE